MMDAKIRLNPFVYISETDIRFYFLVLLGIIMPASLFFFIFSYNIISVQTSFFFKILILIALFSFIPILIYWNYRISPKKIIKRNKLKEFDKPDHCKYISKLMREHLSHEKKPKLIYNYELTDTFAFGTGDRLFIGLSGRLITDFRKNIESFKTVFLHEFAHITNKDVTKICLVNSMLKIFFLTMILPLAIIMLILILFNLIILLLATFLFISGSLKYSLSELLLGFGRDIGLIVLNYSPYIIYILIFYLLINQMIRLREFYADAKAVEWEESSEKIIKTLEEIKTLKRDYQEEHTKFRILKKFHPFIDERIKVLKNNLDLFTPSLLVAFTVGWYYYEIVLNLVALKLYLFSESMEIIGPDIQASTRLIRAFISIFIFSALMLIVSSSFHKMTLKDIFINNKEYLSKSTILNIAKFSMIFGLGGLIIAVITTISMLSTNGLDFSYMEGDYMENPPTTALGVLLLWFKGWIFDTYELSIVLVFLSVFAGILIRMSFSEKEAKKNFLIITTLSSLLYIIIHFFSMEFLHNRYLPIIFLIIFSVITYIFIKLKVKTLYCPNCSNRIFNLSELKLNCSNCHFNLYSWAIYSFY